jgi:hypothetical protein
LAQIKHRTFINGKFEAIKMNSPNITPSIMDPSDLLLPAGEKHSDIRRRYIAEAAYYKYEKRGFAPGYDIQDWLEAEREIEALLAEINYL